MNKAYETQKLRRKEAEEKAGITPMPRGSTRKDKDITVSFTFSMPVELKARIRKDVAEQHADSISAFLVQKIEAGYHADPHYPDKTAIEAVIRSMVEDGVSLKHITKACLVWVKAQPEACTYDDRCALEVELTEFAEIYWEKLYETAAA